MIGLIAGPTFSPSGQSASFKQMNSRTKHRAKEDIASLQLVFANWYVGGALAETGTGATTTIKASIEYPAGVFTQALFGGSPSGSIASGANKVSDAVGVVIPEGAEFWVRSYQTNSSGVPYMTGFEYTLTTDSYAGIAEAAASGLSDKSMGGTISFAVAMQFNAAPPVAIIGNATRPSVLIIGDSRAAGYNDLADTDLDIGTIQRQLGGLATINAGHNSDTCQTFIASHAQRVALADYVTHVIVELGINDLIAYSRPAAQVKADIETIIGYFTQSVFVATTEPVTTSSDLWTTLAGQTTHANNPARVAYNNYVRAGLIGAAGYFDLADGVESNRDSGKWAAGPSCVYTKDGIHASILGYQVMRRKSPISPQAINVPPTSPLFATPKQAADGRRDDLMVTPQGLREGINSIKEEMVFFPFVFGGTSQGSGSYAEAYGRYRIVGNLCFIDAKMTWSGHTGTGALEVFLNGAPNAKSSSVQLAQPLQVAWNLLTYSAVPEAFINQGSVLVDLYSVASGGNGTRVSMDAAAALWIHGWYFID